MGHDCEVVHDEINGNVMRKSRKMKNGKMKNKSLLVILNVKFPIKISPETLLSSACYSFSFSVMVSDVMVAVDRVLAWHINVFLGLVSSRPSTQKEWNIILSSFTNSPPVTVK